MSDGEGGPDPRSGPKVRQPAQTESRIVGWAKLAHTPSTRQRCQPVGHVNDLIQFCLYVFS
jgi:hypothetical protein